MNIFLIIFSQSDIRRQDILDFIDKRKEVLNWYTYWANGIFIASDRDAHTMQQLLHKRFPQLLFLVTHVHSNDALESDGWLPEELWNFINDPRPAEPPAKKKLPR